MLLVFYRWYLGELSEEAGTTVLQSCGKFNVFIVYKTKDHYVLSARFVYIAVYNITVGHQPFSKRLIRMTVQMCIWSVILTGQLG